MDTQLPYPDTRTKLDPGIFTALRLLCTPRFTPEHRLQLSGLLAQPINWTELFQTTLSHDVAPLAVARLCQHGVDFLPEDFLEGLEIYLEGQALRGQTLAAELGGLLACFAAEGVKAIPIKGPSLCLDLYADLSLRDSRDLDILFPEDDIDRTLDLLAQAAYQPDPKLSPRQLQAIREDDCEFMLFKHGHCPLEPHWMLAPASFAFDLDYAALWQSAYAGDFLGTPCLRLPKEQELLLLCLHGAKSEWEKLKWIVDIAAFIEVHADTDWQSLFRLAEQQGCVRMIHLGLELAVHLFGTALPNPAAQNLSEDKLAATLAQEVMLRFENNQLEPSNSLGRFWFFWRLRERARDRWRYLLRTVFIPHAKHYGLLPLPKALDWGYYPLKLLYDYVWLPIRYLASKVRN